MSQPNVLYIMTDQQRWDTIQALGNQHIYTPNLDRLVARGVSFSQAYSTCPVCMPARYTIRTGCEPLQTRVFENGYPQPLPHQDPEMTGRCGPYLAQRMKQLGYRTFGIGKFHTHPWDEELGYEVHLHSEELYSTPEQRRRDSYARWIADKHPEFDFIEALMGERSEMYYMPQMSPLPAQLNVEHWAAERAIEQLAIDDGRPYFGMVSFVGPHPPFAPPIPYNRMYDPEQMSPPVYGDPETDHMDEQIPWMNHVIWADFLTDTHAQILKARYYGEISYIDNCLGQILDAVDQRGDAENTLICFFSDHGDHLGDHRAWQKESFFEGSCHIPFLLSWPDQIPAGQQRSELVCLTDLFGIATTAAGQQELRDGHDVLGTPNQKCPARQAIVGYYGWPGTPNFKVMVRSDRWKYIHMSNGGHEQLFAMLSDPNEQHNLAAEQASITAEHRAIAMEACQRPEGEGTVHNGTLRKFEFTHKTSGRIYQFDQSRGINGFPSNPENVFQTESR